MEGDRGEISGTPRPLGGVPFICLFKLVDMVMTSPDGDDVGDEMMVPGGGNAAASNDGGADTALSGPNAGLMGPSGPNQGGKK